MSIAENKVIARRFLQAWNADGLSVVDELADPNIVVFYSHLPEPLRGAESLKEALIQTATTFPDLRITEEELLAEGDKVAVRWTYRATHQHGEVFGIPATDLPVRVSGITIYRIANGRVVEETGVVDNFDLMLQLGATPALEQVEI